MVLMPCAVSIFVPMYRARQVSCLYSRTGFPICATSRCGADAVFIHTAPGW